MLFSQDIGIDLGTANTLVFVKGKGIVIREPSVVAVDVSAYPQKVVAVGNKAKQMIGRTPGSITAVRPLKDGVIADFEITSDMLKEFIKMAISSSPFSKARVLICIPSGVTEVERKAVHDAARSAGAKYVSLIEEPMAAAIGIGEEQKESGMDEKDCLNVEAPEGNMIVDIGGGTTEIAVISLGGIVSNNSIKMAGDDFNSDIQEYMAHQHNVKVSERMAERIKVNVGSALTDLGDQGPEDYIVNGPNRITALPMQVPVCYQEIAHCLEKSIAKIEAAVLNALENTPPEIYADIVKNGIYITGGGALLRGLDKRLTDKINIKFHVAKDPLLCVAKGTGVALKNVNHYSFLMR